MYDLIHCYDVLHLLFCLPIHKWQRSFCPWISVHANFLRWDAPVKLKGARPLRRSWRGIWRRNLRNEWVFRVFPLFQLPRSPTSQEVMFLTIQVKGPTQEFKKRTTVLVKNEESLVFVQTDKPIYKPEQTGTEAYSQDNFPKVPNFLSCMFPSQRNPGSLIACLTNLQTWPKVSGTHGKYFCFSEISYCLVEWKLSPPEWVGKSPNIYLELLLSV